MAQDKRKPFSVEQRGANSVGWPVRVFIGDEFGVAANHLQVVVPQYFKLVIFGQWSEQRGKVQNVFFTEVIEDRLVIRAAGVERALKRLRVAVVILHIVGENHELRDVGKALELGVLEAFVDTVTLR